MFEILLESSKPYLLQNERLSAAMNMEMREAKYRPSQYHPKLRRTMKFAIDRIVRFKVTVRPGVDLLGKSGSIQPNHPVV